jgi:signal transduction histidine kinase/signal recognition particle receptor subunit beta
MVQFDNQYRQIKVKIVYYGPARGGKTTCLQHIHRVTDPQRRTKLYSLNTASDRTLFFDLLSLNLGRIRGYRLAIQLYTVPGQVQYNATRRAVLSGADGVVFVADSQANQRQPNLDSLENLGENLGANGLDFDTIPLVFQYNKRDLDALLQVDEMEQALNLRQAPHFPSVAIEGEGVMEAFAAVGEHTLAAVAEKLGVGASEQAIRRLRDQVQDALEPLTGETAVAEDAGDVEVTTPVVETGPDEALDSESLVGEAVRANIAMTDLNLRLETVSRQLERKVQVLAGLADFGSTVAEQHDPTGVLRALVDRTVELLGVQASAVLIVPRSGPLREELRHGVESDPLLATADEAGEPLAVSLVEDGVPRLFARQLDGDVGDGGLQIEAVEAAGFGSAVVVPMVVQDRILGLLTAYADHDRLPFDEDDLQLAMVLGASAAIAYTGAEAWRQIEALNRDLEGQVTDRTEELRKTLDRVQQLADDLQEKNELLENAYRDLSELDRLKADLIGRISKEFKTPVNSVLTAAKILADDVTDADDRGGRFITIIRDQAEKLSELIQSVVQASMLATAGDRPELKKMPIEDLLRKAIAPLRDRAQERQVGLNILIPSGLNSILCEPATTEVALRAVVKNAIEFNQNGGAVKLEVRRVTRGDQPWLTIRVIDTGVGIPDQNVERIFDTFWQGEGANGERPPGVGLGLTIAKRIVESHGGTITVKSAVAEGSEVTLSLPQRQG